MNQTYEHDVFISYARKDFVDDQNNIIPGNEVSKILKRLQQEHINYWYDQDGIYSGNEFTQIIPKKIKSSRLFLYISSENSNSSKWASNEIGVAFNNNKFIIPIRIDKSKYNDQVEFFISGISFIEYYKGSEKGLNDMVFSIKKYLEKLEDLEKENLEKEKREREAERIKEEEKKRQEELAKKQREAEQQSIIRSIKIKLETLNNEETKIEADRRTLLISADMVADQQERERIKASIIDTSPIRKKHKEEARVYEDIETELEEKIKILTKKKEELIQANGDLAITNGELQSRIIELEAQDKLTQQEKKSIKEKESSIRELKKQIIELKDQNNRYYRNWDYWWRDSKAKKNLCWFFAILILLFIGTAIFFWLHGNIKIATHDNIKPTPKTFLYKNSKLISKDSSQNTLDKSNMESNYGEEAYNIGRDYHYGINGKTKDYTEAMKWYKIASDKGNDRAQFNIGLLYFHGGFGVSKDYGQAEVWFRKAKELGNYDATKYLNYMIQKGIIAK